MEWVMRKTKVGQGQIGHHQRQAARRQQRASQEQGIGAVSIRKAEKGWGYA